MRTMSGGPCTHYDCTNRNSFGYCKTTACINQNYQHEQWMLTTNRTEPVIVKPNTNADRIRAMTDEELAEWYWWMLNYVRGATDSRTALLDWLKQEVSDA